MSDAEIIARGGLAPSAAKVGDVVGARAYRHPALGERLVVRLAPDAIAAGTDLEMSALGFAAPEVRDAVARERPQALGFPGWALVHAPKLARHALAVVKEMKQVLRRAKSKPGAAREGIDAIGARLGKTVPQFLPSFYEEAGRAFIAYGSPKFAAACFGKAREAERVHALDVDEAQRGTAFLEFALAGAVTTKALGEYAKQLGDREPSAAYAQFRALCVHRVLGGLPPWSGMPKELRRLAEAADLDAEAEELAIVAEIIEAPAFAKAPAEVWRAYGDAIAQLARGSASVRAAVREMFPTTDGVDDAWLDLVAFDVAPSAGWAAWFDKLVLHLTRSWRSRALPVRAFAILRALAPAITEPIACARRWELELDLAELALELGVPIAPRAQFPGASLRLDLDDWAKQANEPERGRDPVRVAAHPVLGPRLAAAVGEVLGRPVFDAAARGKTGFVVAKRAWVEGLVERAERGGLVDLAAVVALVEKGITAETFAEIPELHARLAAVDVAAALARTLRIGIYKEFEWAVLDAAAAELGDKSVVHGALPVVVAVSATRAIALTPTARLATHDLVIPPKHELAAIRFIGGQFLVGLKQMYKISAYWSDAPHARFDADASVWQLQAYPKRAVVLADGAWQEGHVAIRAGDRAVPDQRVLAAHDGATAWFAEHVDGAWRMREVSRRGEPGRASWPAFLEAEDGWTTDGLTSYVLATPLTRSPLGVANGMHGVRVRRRGDVYEIARIDGATWRASDARIVPSELIVMPGDDTPRPVTVDDRTNAITIYDPTGLAAGTTVTGALPISMWHALATRSPADSARLRAFTNDEARALLGGAAPAIDNAVLSADVVTKVVAAGDLGQRLSKICAERAPGLAAPREITGGSDDELRRALGIWLPHSYGPDGSAVLQIARVAELFGGDRADRRDRSVAGTRFDWYELPIAPNLLVTLALAIGTPAELRSKLAELYRAICALPPPETLRIYDALGTSGIADYTVDRVWFEVRWHAGNAFAIRSVAIHDNHFRVLQYAPDGKFVAPPGGLQPGVALHGTARPHSDIDALLAPGFAATSWSTAAATRLAAATGLSYAEAALFWAGSPRLNERGLPKELREALGLKANQVEVARQALQVHPIAKRRAVIDAAGRVAALLDGSAVDAMAAAWLAQIGARVAVPDALLATAGREVNMKMAASEALAMIADAERSPLAVDGAWALDAYGNVIRARSGTPLVGQVSISAPAAFASDALQAVVAYIPLLFAELPVGDPLRAKIPIVHALALARLANPDLLLDAGSYYPEGGMAAIDKLLDALGGTPLGPFEMDVTGAIVRGAIVRRGKYMVDILLRPAEYERLDPVIASLAMQTSEYGHRPLASIGALRSADYAGFAARVAVTPVSAGGWEQDPSASVPALVSRVAKEMTLSADGAALYLMYLALLWPTPKKIAQWTGWPAKRLATANAELVARSLVVVAKRARAQRTHFLPGGWEALASPHAPLETWKLPLYLVGPQGAWKRELPGAIYAPAPFHVLFERACARIASGDVPAYDKVTTR